MSASRRAERGLIVTVAGPDGSGKTSFCDALIAGLLRNENVRRIHHRFAVLPVRGGSTADPSQPHAQSPYPRGISEAGQYAIDQFVMRGGKLIAFLDASSLMENRNQNPMMGMNAYQNPAFGFNAPQISGFPTGSIALTGGGAYNPDTGRGFAHAGGSDCELPPSNSSVSSTLIPRLRARLARSRFCASVSA